MPHARAGNLQIHYVEPFGPAQRVASRRLPPLRDLRTDGDAPSGDRLPVVFVHGNWSTHRWWISTATALARRLWNHRLLAIDMRGRGDTRGPDHGYSIAELADDLRGFLDALGLARAHLVGHSLGCAVISELALAHPERVASLVVAAPCWVDGMPEQWARREDQARLHADRGLFGRLLAGMARKAPRDQLWDELVVTGHRQRELATMRNLDALIAWRPGDALRALVMPRVVVDGELDPLCGGPTATRAAAAMTCERVCMAGIGHSPNLEAPEQLASIIRRIVCHAESTRNARYR
jgi:pimeloyl-ACP methyl ester carboxylesterase